MPSSKSFACHTSKTPRGSIGMFSQNLKEEIRLFRRNLKVDLSSQKLLAFVSSSFDQACGQFPSKHGALPSKPCLFTLFRTLFRNGALPIPFFSIASALFPMRRRVCPPTPPKSYSLSQAGACELTMGTFCFFLSRITGHESRKWLSWTSHSGKQWVS